VKDRPPLVVLVGAAVVLAAALAVFGSGSATTVESSTTSFADIAIPDPSLPTTTVARAIEVLPDPITHLDGDPTAVPGLTGRLVAVVEQNPNALVVVDTETGARLETALPRVASDFAVDASGSSLAFVGGTDLARETRVVSLEDPSSAVPLPTASSFAWSGDEPNTAVWLEDTAIVLGTFGDATSTGTSILGTIEVDSTRLAGLTAAGWWTTSADPATPRSGLVEFAARTDDAVTWRFPGDIVVPPHTGSRALIARLDIATWRWTFGLGDGDVDPLPWAPGDAAGEHGFAAFAPSGARIAFIGIQGPGSSWIEIQSTEGGPVDRVVVPVRVWDVSWSPDGQFVVMPGSDEAGRHAVVLFDTSTGDVHAIEFEDRVRFAAIVPPHASRRGPAGP
jgi:hypothetical protein